MAEMDKGWRPIAEAPKDGTVFYSAVPIKWLPYKPASEQYRRGIKGRWVESNGYGGWVPCKNGEPGWWQPISPLDLNPEPEAQP